ncbi:iron-sulfur-binding protein [Armatimonadota bacterium]|nr:iron-sulfur-binding protein [Armatimonadota bacterium]
MALLETQVPAVTLSETAAQQIRELMESNGKTDSALRIFVQGGGCSGLNYGMALDDEIEEGDLVYSFFGVKVVLDGLSYNYIKGASIDFVEDEMGGGFKIDNPNATKSCGCGSPFSTEDGESSGGGCGSGGCGSGGCGSR